MKITPDPGIKKTKGLIGHAVRKELSLRQSKLIGKVSDSSEIEKYLAEELDNVLLDVPYIYKNLLEGMDYEKYILETRAEMLSEIKIINEKLKDVVDELGVKGALQYLTPWKVEYSIKSENLKLSGRIDKVMKQDNLIPVELKTSNPSEDGVWEGDRLQTCAYAMLLEDKFNEKINYGYVEYIKIHEQRPVMTTEQLRRRVINARDCVIEILEGKIPEICPHGSGKKCDACDFKDACYEI
jgi:CRISPR-associated exonuclease Cas4